MRFIIKTKEMFLLEIEQPVASKGDPVYITLRFFVEGQFASMYFDHQSNGGIYTDHQCDWKIYTDD